MNHGVSPCRGLKSPRYVESTDQGCRAPSGSSLEHSGTALQLLTITLLAVVLSGCGGSGGPATVWLEGTVTFDGQPIETGYITFASADPAVRGYAIAIENGKFELDVESGDKIIRVTATREVKGLVTFESPDGISHEEYIPARYNYQSELTTTIAEDDPEPLDLKLTSGAGG